MRYCEIKQAWLTKVVLFLFLSIGCGWSPSVQAQKTISNGVLAKLAHTRDLLAEKVLAVLLTQKEINTGEEHVGSYSWTIPQNYQKVHECLRDLKVAPYENFGRITLQAVLAAYWLAFFLAGVFLFYTYAQKLKNDRRARRALQQSKDFLQNVIDANPDPVVISADYDVLFADHSARELAVGGRGFTEAETLKCYELLYGLNHPCESRDGFQCPLRQEKNMLPETKNNKTMRDSNGELRSFEIAMAPLPCNGEFIGMVESFRDVSSRVRAEQARYCLERAVEQTGETIVITDAGGDIQYVNPAFEKITGYRREEALGRNPRFLQSGEHDRAFYEKLWQTLLRGETWQGELVNRHKNGEIYYEDATISPIYDQERRLINFIAVKRDVTKLKRSQQALQESEEYHRSLFNDSPVPLFLQDFSAAALRVEEIRAGGVDDLRAYFKQNQKLLVELAALVETTEMNKAALELYRLEDSPAPRQVLGTILVPDDCLHFADQLAAFTSGLDWYDGSGRNQDSDGKILHVLIKKVVINRARNGLAKVLSAVNDVSELHQMNELKNSLEDQLRQAQKMEAIGTLAGGIAHDFNNILTSIIGYSELALLGLPEDGEAYKKITQVIASGNRASMLVGQILTFSRKEKTSLLVLEPHLVVKDALTMLSSMLPATVSIETEIDSDCGQVKADPTQLYQIVTNLCTNAFQALDKQKGILRVTLQRRELEGRERAVAAGEFAGPFVVLSVTDNGCGMDSATRERIFEPYFTTKAQGQGTGLGLAVVHGIVESYGGFIEVSSELGQGTSFEVYLPVYRETSAAVETPSTVSRSSALPQGTEKILLVDDEETIVNLEKTILKRLGYLVVATTEAREALAMIKADAETFALLITDQSMPFLTGEELAREVAKIRPALPVILCTGYSSVLSKKEALAGGVIRKVFKKPLSLQEFAVGIRQVLDNPEGS